MVSKLNAFYFTIFAVFVTSEAFQVSFNEHGNGVGESATIDAVDGTCYNFSPAWNDRVSQIITPYFACLDVYENSSCSGKVQRYAAGYAMFVELGGTEFNDFISSFRVSSPGKNGCQ
ncbi:uncharacterized protein LOC119066107 [Bradysia coprophila]|uniref:uncharacterized protein LOC119066107 n=1 Tax=Bradysia coprophila TaxID=38358 RepID=UPI00187DCE8E|nr:uncharacterized protein LOC119066107 [Bradysia coprophila]